MAKEADWDGFDNIIKQAIRSPGPRLLQDHEDADDSNAKCVLCETTGHSTLNCVPCELCEKRGHDKNKCPNLTTDTLLTEGRQSEEVAIYQNDDNSLPSCEQTNSGELEDLGAINENHKPKLIKLASFANFKFIGSKKKGGEIDDLRNIVSNSPKGSPQTSESAVGNHNNPSKSNFKELLQHHTKSSGTTKRGNEESVETPTTSIKRQKKEYAVLKRLSHSQRKHSNSPNRRYPKKGSSSPQRGSNSGRRGSKSPKRYSRSTRKGSRSPRKGSRSPRRYESPTEYSKDHQRRARGRSPQMSTTQERSAKRKRSETRISERKRRNLLIERKKDKSTATLFDPLASNPMKEVLKNTSDFLNIVTTKSHQHPKRPNLTVISFVEDDNSQTINADIYKNSGEVHCATVISQSVESPIKASEDSRKTERKNEEKKSDKKINNSSRKYEEINYHEKITENKIVFIDNLDTNKELVVAVTLENKSASSVTSGFGESPYKIAMQSINGNFSCYIPPFTFLNDAKKKPLLEKSGFKVLGKDSIEIDGNIINTTEAFSKYLRQADEILSQNPKKESDNAYNPFVLIFETWNDLTAFFNWVGFSDKQDYLRYCSKVGICPQYESPEINDIIDKCNSLHSATQEEIRNIGINSFLDQLIEVPNYDIPGEVDVVNTEHNLCIVSLKYVKHEGRNAISQIGCVFLTAEGSKLTFFGVSNPFGDRISEEQLNMLNLKKRAETEELLITKFVKFCTMVSEDTQYPTTLVSYSSATTLSVLMKAIQKFEKTDFFYEFFSNFTDVFAIAVDTNCGGNKLNDVPDFEDLCSKLNISHKAEHALDISETILKSLNCLIGENVCKKIKKYTKPMSKLYFSDIKSCFVKFPEDIELNPDEIKEVELPYILRSSGDIPLDKLRVSKAVLMECEIINVELMMKKVVVNIKNTSIKSLMFKKNTKILKIYEVCDPLIIPAELLSDYYQVGSSVDKAICFNKPLQTLSFYQGNEIIDLAHDGASVEDQQVRQIFIPTLHDPNCKFILKSTESIELEPKKEVIVPFFIDKLKLTPKIECEIKVTDESEKYSIKKGILEVKNGKVELPVKNRTMTTVKVPENNIFGYLYYHSDEKNVIIQNIQVQVSETTAEALRKVDTGDIAEIEEIQSEPPVEIVEEKYPNITSHENINIKNEVKIAEENCSSNSEYLANNQPICLGEKPNSLLKESENVTKRLHCEIDYEQFLFVKNFPEFKTFIDACHVYGKMTGLQIEDEKIESYAQSCKDLIVFNPTFSSFESILQEIQTLTVDAIEDIKIHFDRITTSMFSCIIVENCEDFLKIILNYILVLDKEKSLTSSVSSTVDLIQGINDQTSNLTTNMETVLNQEETESNILETSPAQTVAIVNNENFMSNKIDIVTVEIGLKNVSEGLEEQNKLTTNQEGLQKEIQNNFDGKSHTAVSNDKICTSNLEAVLCQKIHPNKDSSQMLSSSKSNSKVELSLVEHDDKDKSSVSPDKGLSNLNNSISVSELSKDELTNKVNESDAIWKSSSIELSSKKCLEKDKSMVSSGLGLSVKPNIETEFFTKEYTKENNKGDTTEISSYLKTDSGAEISHEENTERDFEETDIEICVPEKNKSEEDLSKKEQTKKQNEADANEPFSSVNTLSELDFYKDKQRKKGKGINDNEVSILPEKIIDNELIGSQTEVSDKNDIQEFEEIEDPITSKNVSTCDAESYSYSPSNLDDVQDELFEEKNIEASVTEKEKIPIDQKDSEGCLVILDSQSMVLSGSPENENTIKDEVEKTSITPGYKKKNKVQEVVNQESQNVEHDQELYCYICQDKTHNTKECKQCTRCKGRDHRVADCTQFCIKCKLSHPNRSCVGTNNLPALDSNMDEILNVDENFEFLQICKVKKVELLCVTVDFDCKKDVTMQRKTHDLDISENEFLLVYIPEHNYSRIYDYIRIKNWETYPNCYSGVLHEKLSKTKSVISFTEKDLLEKASLPSDRIKYFNGKSEVTKESNLKVVILPSENYRAEIPFRVAFCFIAPYKCTSSSSETEKKNLNSDFQEKSESNEALKKIKEPEKIATSSVHKSPLETISQNASFDNRESSGQGLIKIIKDGLGIIDSKLGQVLFFIENEKLMHYEKFKAQNVEMEFEAFNANKTIQITADRFFGERIGISYCASWIYAQDEVIYDHKVEKCYDLLCELDQNMKNKLKERSKIKAQQEKQKKQKIQTISFDQEINVDQEVLHEASYYPNKHYAQCTHFPDLQLCEDKFTSVCVQNHNLAHEIPTKTSALVNYCENFLNGICKHSKCSKRHLDFVEFGFEVKKWLNIQRKSCFKCRDEKIPTVAGCKYLKPKELGAPNFCFFKFIAQSGCSKLKCKYLHKLPRHFPPLNPSRKYSNSYYMQQVNEMSKFCSACNQEENVNDYELDRENIEQFEENDLESGRFVLETDADSDECSYNVDDPPPSWNEGMNIDLRDNLRRTVHHEHFRGTSDQIRSFEIRALDEILVKTNECWFKGRICAAPESISFLKGSKVRVRNYRTDLPRGLRLVEGTYGVNEDNQGVLYLSLKAFNSSSKHLEVLKGKRVGEAVLNLSSVDAALEDTGRGWTRRVIQDY